jgi:hypothetical protein
MEVNTTITVSGILRQSSAEAAPICPKSQKIPTAEMLKYSFARVLMML